MRFEKIFWYMKGETNIYISFKNIFYWALLFSAYICSICLKYTLAKYSINNLLQEFNHFILWVFYGKQHAKVFLHYLSHD